MFPDEGEDRVPGCGCGDDLIADYAVMKLVRGLGGLMRGPSLLGSAPEALVGVGLG